MTLLKQKTSISPACDVDSLEKLSHLVKETASIDKVASYKIGFELGLRFGLPAVVDTIRKHSDKVIIYDHQKAGTDIPDTGIKFAKTLASAKVNCAILFPQAGPVTHEAWIKALQDQGLTVMVGGLMTHPGFIESDNGYLSDSSVKRVYSLAAKNGVRDFVVPGTKIEAIRKIRSHIIEEIGNEEAHFYSPGFITQGGSISEALEATGGCLHAFVGRGIYQAENINEATKEIAKALN